MSKFENQFNPDLQKYGFSEYDIEPSSAPVAEPEPTTNPASEAKESVLSRLKTLIQKRKK